jgi:hypothetical protein
MSKCDGQELCELAGLKFTGFCVMATVITFNQAIGLISKNQCNICHLTDHARGTLVQVTKFGNRVSKMTSAKPRCRLKKAVPSRPLRNRNLVQFGAADPILGDT